MINNKLLMGAASIGLLGLSLPAFALLDCSGFYLGAQAGVSYSSYDLDSFLDEHLDNNGRVGRVYLGYQLNLFLGIETGFALFSEVDLPKDFGDIKTAHWDLLLKVGMPLGETGFRVDVKGGAAYFMADFDADDLANTVGFHDKEKKEYDPVAGVSLAFNFNKNFSVDVSYLHVFGDPKSGALGTPNVDMATVGFSVLFAL